jgi:PTS system nitrogen regulatory IIA component
MDLSVRDAAELLKVSENLLYRWIQKGSLSAYRVHEQYWLNRIDLLEWAVLHHYSVSDKLFNLHEQEKRILKISSALKRGGIFYEVPGAVKEEVAEAAARFSGIPSEMDPEFLIQLLTRDSSIPFLHFIDGIAIPHPRFPILLPIEEPVLLLCCLKSPIDFSLTDTLPVQVFFLLFSPSTRIHFQIVAFLTILLSDSLLKDLVLMGAPREAILDRISVMEMSR